MFWFDFAVETSRRESRTRHETDPFLFFTNQNGGGGHRHTSKTKGYRYGKSTATTNRDTASITGCKQPAQGYYSRLNGLTNTAGSITVAIHSITVAMKTSKEESTSKGASAAAPKKGKKNAKKARKGSRKKPKRPMTAYNYFLRACHDEASKKLEAEKAERKKAAADGGADDVDKNEGRSKEEFQRLSKEFGERWRNISPEEHAK